MEVGIFPARTVSKNRIRCVVETCRSKSHQNLNLRYHGFPKPNESFINIKNSDGKIVKVDRYEAWKNALKMKNVPNSSRICSLHFEKNDYILPDMPTSRRHLKRTAVPSCNLTGTTNLTVDKQIKELQKKSKDITTNNNNQGNEINEELIVPERLECNENIIPIKAENSVEKMSVENDPLAETVPVLQDPSKNMTNIPLNQIYFAISPAFVAQNYIPPTPPPPPPPPVVPQKLFKDAEAQVNTDDIVPRFIRFIMNDTELKIATGIESFAVLNKLAEMVRNVNDNKYEVTNSRMNTRDRIIMTFIKLKQDLSYSFLAVMFKEYTAHHCQRIIFDMIKILSGCLKDIAKKPIHRFNKKKQIFRVFESTIPTRLKPIADDISTVISAIMNLNSPSDENENENENDMDT